MLARFKEFQGDVVATIRNRVGQTSKRHRICEEEEETVAVAAQNYSTVAATSIGSVSCRVSMIAHTMSFLRCANPSHGGCCLVSTMINGSFRK